MNDTQIDSLLEKMKGSGLPSLDSKSEEAIVAKLHIGIRRHRRNSFAALAILAAGFACIFIGKGIFKCGVLETAMSPIAKLAVAQEMFPETGVALVNGELITFEHQATQTTGKYLGLCLHRSNGKASMTLDTIVGDDDYIALTDGPVTGGILVNRCSEREMIVDVDLVFSRPNGRKQNVKETVLLHPSGLGTASSPAHDDYSLEFVMGSIPKG